MSVCLLRVEGRVLHLEPSRGNRLIRSCRFMKEDGYGDTRNYVCSIGLAFLRGPAVYAAGTYAALGVRR